MMGSRQSARTQYTHPLRTWSDAMAATQVPATLMPATQVPAAVVCVPGVVRRAVARLP
jgi:hypothetical protein